jgi:PmbA protein
MSVDKLICNDPKVSSCDEVSYSEHLVETKIENSLGLNVAEKYSYSYLFAEFAVGKGDDIYSTYEIKTAHKFSELDVIKFVPKWLKEAKAHLKAKSIESKTCPVVFDNGVFPNLLEAFVDSFIGMSVVRKTTPLADSLGSQIAAPIFNLVDDPFYKKGFINHSFDGEGVPCKKKHIIKDGVLTNFFHDLKSAKMLKAKPLGNSFGPANLLVEKGRLSKKEILEKVGDGIYLTDLMGLHAGINEQSGDFSIKTAGFLIENGKLGKPVKMIVVSGNMYQLLKDIIYVGNDYSPSSIDVFSPTIAVSRLTIAGEK